MSAVVTLMAAILAAAPPKPPAKAPPPGARLLSNPGEEAMNPRLDASTGEVAFEVAADGARTVHVYASARGRALAVPSQRIARDHDFTRGSGKALLNELGDEGRWAVTIGGREPASPSAASDLHGAVSPDGKLVAFVSGRTGRGDVYVVEAAKSNQSPRRLTQDPWPEVQPRWSPDGRRLAFLRLTPRGKTIVVLAGASGVGNAEEHVAAAERDGPLNVSWSPDGKQLGWYGHDWSVGTSLFVSEASFGTGQKVLGGVLPQREGPAWLPDGKGGQWLLAVRQDDVVVALAADGTVTELAIGTFGHGELAAGSVRGQRTVALTALGLAGSEGQDVRHRKVYLFTLP